MVTKLGITEDTCIGLFIGLIQGTSLKIMIAYNAAGVIAEINIYAIFVFLIIFGIVSLTMLIFLSRNVKRKNL